MRQKRGKKTTPKPPNTPDEETATGEKEEPYVAKIGDYFYAAACAKCGEPVILGGGGGPVPKSSKITFSGSGSVGPKACPYCGHMNLFKPSEIRKAQVKPR